VCIVRMKMRWGFLLFRFSFFLRNKGDATVGQRHVFTKMQQGKRKDPKITRYSGFFFFVPFIPFGLGGGVWCSGIVSGLRVRRLVSIHLGSDEWSVRLSTCYMYADRAVSREYTFDPFTSTASRQIALGQSDMAQS